MLASPIRHSPESQVQGTAHAAATGETFTWPPQPLVLAAWGYLVVFGSLIAFNAYMVLLARTSAGLASTYTFVNPMIALVLGVTLGGETVTAFEWTAAGVVLVGVLMLLRRPPVRWLCTASQAQNFKTRRTDSPQA